MRCIRSCVSECAKVILQPTSVSQAAHSADVQRVLKELGNGVDVNAKDSGGVPSPQLFPGLSFTLPCRAQRLQPWDWHADAGINRPTPNCIACTGNTPLIWATFVGAVDVIEVLLSRGADTKARYKKGARKVFLFAALGPPRLPLLALARAHFSGAPEIVSMRGLCPVALTPLASAGWTPLHIAAREGFVEVARTLLAHGASLHDLTDVRVCRPSRRALTFWRRHRLATRADTSAPPAPSSAPEQKGQTPLDLAAGDSMKQLLKQHARAFATPASSPSHGSEPLRDAPRKMCP